MDISHQVAKEKKTENKMKNLLLIAATASSLFT
jgi:hypothetical protein